MFPIDSFYFDCALFVFIAVVIHKLIYEWNQKSIPGPIGLPVVGYLPFIKDELHISLTKLAEQYGPMFRIKLGSIDAIVLNDYQSIVDCLVKPEVSARPSNTIYNAIDNNTSMALSHGEQWKEQRKFANKKLRDFGVGKRQIEQTILHEINSFRIELDAQKGIPHNLYTLITGFTLNIILQFLAGHRIDNNSDYFRNLLKHLGGEHAVNGNGNEPKFATIGSFFPNLINVCIKFNLFGVDQVINALQDLKKFGEELVLQREKVCQEINDEISFIDEFIKEIEVAKKKSFTRQMLINNVSGYFPAGVETLADALAMTLVTLCHFTEFQVKMSDEINEVLGSDRIPTLEDRKKLVFTHAFLLETQRWITYIPLNLPRRALEMVKLNNFTITRNTQIWANIWSAHRDRKIWDKPDEFNPSRFLSEHGTIVNENKLLTFSSSKRSCPGESLANSCLFLFVVSLLQKYSIRTVDGKEASLDYYTIVSKRPKKMNFEFVRKNC